MGDRNMNPHKYAVAAMWLLGDRYSKQPLGCMDFWDSLSDSDKQRCQNMVADIAKVGERPNNG